MVLVSLGKDTHQLVAQESEIGSNFETIAGTGEPGNNGRSGHRLELNIGDPFGVEFGPDEALYVTEVRNHRVWRVELETGEMQVIAGTGEMGYSGDGGAAIDARLNEPYEIRFDVEGNLYFVEMKNHLVRRVDRESGVITTVAGTGEQGFGGDGGPAIEATMNRPHSIVIDRLGNIYIADIGNHRIRKVDASTGRIETIAGTGERILPVDGQVARNNPMLGPRALFLQQQILWIALREGHSIWKLNLEDEKLRHIAGTGEAGTGGDGGPAVDAQFKGPKGLTVSDSGHVFVVDTENHVIREIDLATGIISTVAGVMGQKGGAGDGGVATQATLDRPHGIAISTNGLLVIGDTLNHRVRGFQWIDD